MAGSGHESIQNDTNVPGILVYSPNAQVEEYREPEDDNEPDRHWYAKPGVELVGFPAEPPYRAWCGILRNQTVPLLRDGVVCYNTDTFSLGRFPSVKDDDMDAGGSVLHATEDTLWMISISSEINHVLSKTNVLLSSFNVTTMETRLVSSKNTTYYGDEETKRILDDISDDASLPANIQRWLRSLSRFSTSIHSLKFNRSLPYVPMQDGSAVFIKAATPWGARSRSKTGTNVPGILVYSPDKEIVEYIEDENEPGIVAWDRTPEVELVGFPAEPPYSSWCGVFRDQRVPLLREGVVCYNIKTVSLGLFPSAKVQNVSERSFDVTESKSFLYATEDTLWMLSASSKRNRSTGGEITNVLLSSFNVTSMTLELVLSKNATLSREEYGYRNARMGLKNRKCRDFHWVRTGVSLVTLGFVANHLCRLEIPSCAVPASVAVAVLVDGLSEADATGFILLTLAGFCLYLLLAKAKIAMFVQRHFSGEMLVWGFYSLQIATSWQTAMSIRGLDDLMSFDSRILVPVTAQIFVLAASAVLLNHPIFQIISICLSSLGFLSLLFIFQGLGGMVPMVLLSLALGFFQAGRLLQTYRMHLIVYVRRLCRFCSALAMIDESVGGDEHFDLQ